MIRGRLTSLWLMTLGLLFVAVAVGCQREAPRPSPRPSPKPGPPPPVAADREDDPDAPPALPKSFVIPGWTKTVPVRVIKAGKLPQQVLDPSIATGPASTFPVALAASCRYELDDMKADTLLIRTDRVEDAFGLFQVMAKKPGTAWPDDSIRLSEMRDGRTLMLAWQGHHCVHIAFTGSGHAPDQADCERLFNRILLALPAEDAPLLARLATAARLADSRIWCIRDISALAAADHPTLREVYANSIAMAERLDLTGQAMMTIAAGRLTDKGPVNVIWLIEYPDNDRAAATAKRYANAMASTGASRIQIDGNTRILGPFGKLLVGTWTADRDDSNAILAQLVALLTGEAVEPGAITSQPATPTTKPARD